jgi:hypothetical protein
VEKAKSEVEQKEITADSIRQTYNTKPTLRRRRVAEGELETGEGELFA